MTRLLIVSSLSLLITACTGGHTYQAKTQISSMAQAEFSAWEKVNRINKEQCPQGSEENPIPKSQAMKTHECWENLARKYVAPVAIAPDLFMQYLNNTRKNSLDYKKGTIDRDEVILANQQTWSTYYSALDARAKNALLYANQQDQIAAQNTQRALQNLSQQEHQRELARIQALNNSNVRNTNCRIVGANSLNCQSW